MGEKRSLTPTKVLEARGVKKSDKGMASQSVVTLLSALFFASIIGVTIAYPPIVRDVLENDNDNPLQIAKLLSHFSSQPQLQQDDNKEIEKRTQSFSAWGGKRGGQGSQFSAWGGKRSGQGSQFSAWGGKRSDWVDLVRSQLAEEALREMAQRRPNRVVRAGRASFSAWGGRK